MTTTLVCPVCRQNNTWTNNKYKQGSPFKCASCSVRLQQIFCPHCASSNIWSNPRISIEGQLINCRSCSKSFQFICCPHCQGVNLWQKAHYEQGRAYSCTFCTRRFQHVNCAHCSEPNAYSIVKTIQGDRLVCRSCKKTHQYIQCPHCRKDQVWKNSNYTAGSVVACHSCKQSFAYMRCPHCQNPNFWKKPLNTTLSFTCSECKKDMCAAVSRTKPPTSGKSNFKRTPSLTSLNPIAKCSSLSDLRREREPSVPRIRTTDDGAAAKHLLRATFSCPQKKIPGCSYLLACKEYVKQLAWPISLFNVKHDRCYCQTCYSDHCSDTLRVAEADYVVPRGWAGFGLGVDPFRSDDIWNTWIVVYHGTTTIAAQSILAHRQFLLPGDHLINGYELPIRPGHIPGKIHIYTSPSIRYASLDVYSTVYSFQSPTTGQRYNAQIVLQCKQKPGTFGTQRETVGWGTKRICNIIPNDRIEHYTNRRSTIVPYRLLIRLTNV